MPRISRFFGIIIAMYYDDHNINIIDLSVLEGKLPSRALGMVIEWAVSHQSDLLTNWELAKTLQPLRTIDPLL